MLCLLRNEGYISHFTENCSEKSCFRVISEITIHKKNQVIPLSRKRGHSIAYHENTPALLPSGTRALIMMSLVTSQ